MKASEVGKVLKMCEELGVPKKEGKILAITVQVNREGRFFSAFVSADGTSLLDNYPDPDALSLYDEKRIGNLMVCFNNNLPEIPVSLVTVEDSGENFPFCCSTGVRPTDFRRISREAVFQGFLEGKGSSDYVFEVKKQIDGGKLIFTKFFSLTEGVRSELPEFDTFKASKVHSYKNYSCKRHNLFFGVDLYKAGSSVYNHHHMRLFPFTRNVSRIDEIMKEAHS